LLVLAATIPGISPRTASADEATTAAQPVSFSPLLLDPKATQYATFQSHNQKLLQNGRGIFLSYLHSRNEDFTAQEWRLLRSVDFGEHFETVFEATSATNPPIIETDSHDNLYLARADFNDGNAYLYRFPAGASFETPQVSPIPGAAAGKYCMFLDEPRGQLYFWAHNGVFAVVGLDGTLRHCANLFTRGQDAYLQYPHLFLDRDGVLHAAWTTSKDGIYLYWDIHYMRSRDGGQSWERMDGQPLTPPIPADQAGPTDRISLDDEFEVHTWLSSMYVQGGKLFFCYLAQFQDAPRQHLMRYDSKSSGRELDISPVLRGETIEIKGLDGFFCAARKQQNNTLYFVGNAAGRIAVLCSHDQGATWRDHALSHDLYQPYAIGGSRWLSEDGHIVGSFTQQNSDGSSALYFFRVPGIEARAQHDKTGPPVKSL
jgi:hypothetical protein